MNMAPRAATRTLRRSLPSLAAAACTALAAAIALAQSPSPSASATATGTGTGSDAAPPNLGVAVDAYAWPTDASPEPSDADYDAGTLLQIPDNPFEQNKKDNLYRKVCTARAVREWVRITCAGTGTDTSFGVIWGMAGDLSSLKGRMPLRGDLLKDKSPPSDFMEASTRRMGASASLSFQAKPGSAFLASISEMGWDIGGWGDASMFVRTGATVDVSWAVGEKTPSIQLRATF
jgi:hypothetical protein